MHKLSIAIGSACLAVAIVIGAIAVADTLGGGGYWGQVETVSSGPVSTTTVTATTSVSAPYYIATQSGDQNYAQDGKFRTANNQNIMCARNAGNTADECLRLDASGVWGVGSLSGSASVRSAGYFQAGASSFYNWASSTRLYTPANGSVQIATADTTKKITLDATTTDVLSVKNGANNASGGVTAGYFTGVQATDQNYAQSGAFRLANNASQCWRNAANTADICVAVSTVNNLNVPPIVSSGIVSGTGQISCDTSSNVGYVGIGASPTATQNYAFFRTNDSIDQTTFHAGPNVGHQLVMTSGDISTGFNKDYDEPQETDFKLCIASSTNPDTDNTQKGCLMHDQNNFEIRSGKGAIELRPNRDVATKGAYMSVTQSELILPCAGGGGSATLTATNLVPQYAILYGVSARIGSSLTGPTSVQLGDGSDADLFGTTSTLTAGQTIWNPSANYMASNPQLTALSPVLTMVGGNCTAGSVTISASFTTIIPPTAN